jgi:hypothetical protein
MGASQGCKLAVGASRSLARSSRERDVCATHRLRQPTTVSFCFFEMLPLILVGVQGLCQLRLHPRRLK